MAITFWDKYKTDIRPILEEIDLTLKLNDGFISAYSAAKLLSLSEDEVQDITGRSFQEYLQKDDLLKILKNGSSYICGLCSREINCGSPSVYSKENISYIYNIPIEYIDRACQALQIKIITSSLLPFIFSAIDCKELSNTP